MTSFLVVALFLVLSQSTIIPQVKAPSIVVETEQFGLTVTNPSQTNLLLNISLPEGFLASQNLTNFRLNQSSTVYIYPITAPSLGNNDKKSFIISVAANFIYASSQGSVYNQDFNVTIVEKNYYDEATEEFRDTIAGLNIQIGELGLEKRNMSIVLIASLVVSIGIAVDMIVGKVWKLVYARREVERLKNRYRSVN